MSTAWAKTIDQARRVASIRRAVYGLVGLPVGGDYATAEAKRRVQDALPHHEDRLYTVGELIEACLEEGPDGRYRWRDTRP